MGNLLSVVVHAANIHDTKSGILPAVSAILKYKTLEKFCGDAGYRGTFVEQTEKIMRLMVDIIERTEKGWEILPKRWIVERTFAWLNFSRRLSKDYEITVGSEENMIKLSHIHTLLKRL